jgi:4-amino-4-deoxy-L-arabinose transferase-like glycosyltransferase
VKPSPLAGGGWGRGRSSLGLTALVLLAALTLARLAVARYAPLAPDEAYYWVWSRALAPGYLDAPPMVALWIRAGTWLAGPGALGIRLLGPLAAALGSLLLWDAGERLLPGRRAGLVGAALLNAMLLFGVGAVVMTPDTPLLFFWVACLWALARFLGARRGLWLVLAGLFGGLALDSKYTAALLAPAVLLWLLAVPELRRWLVRPALWLGALAGAAAFAPVLAWNAAHGWASLIKQGGRVGDFRPANAIRFLGELAAGQAGLATPLVFVLCVAGGLAALRLAWRRRDPAWTLLATLTVLPALVFVQHAFGDRVQANWPAVLYPSATLAAAGLEGRIWTRLRVPASALGLGITALAYAQATAAPFPLPAPLDPTALRLAGWRGLAEQVETARRVAGASFVAADDYGEAAELARAMPASVPVVGVERRWALFALPRPAIGGRVGVLVRSARRGLDLDPDPWSSLHPLGGAERRRGAQVVEAFRLYRVVGRPGARTSEALLPHELP